MSESVQFILPTDLYAEAEDVSRELGIPINEMARSAFEGYLEGVREARRNDSDEQES
jgi:hypothetical protein